MSDAPNTPDPQVIKQATRLGWVPQESFKGDQAKWVPADQFMESVGPIAPFVETKFKEAETQVRNLQGTVGTLSEVVKQSKIAIEDLKKYHTEQTQQAVEKARADLVSQLKAAKKAGDVDAEVEAQSELSKLDRAVAKETPTTVQPPGPDGTGTPKLHPDFVKWAEDTGWYGRQDRDAKRKTAMAVQIAAEMRDDGDTRTGRAFLDDVAKRTEDFFAAAGGRNTSRIADGEGGAGGTQGDGGSGPSSRKTWADIPQADRDQATRVWRDKLVGAHKSFKTDKEWHASFAQKYWAQF